jgi:formylmethanofuran dehydrogenase subunit E
MVDPKEFLKAALQLHGHECPEMVLGLRAGAAAMNWLGVERSAEDQLLALVRFPEAPCFADGVQAITGCTLGKGNVRILGHGPLSLTLIERATRRAVRVAPRVDVPPSREPNAAAGTLLRRLLRAPQRQILSVSDEFRYRAPNEARRQAGSTWN